MSKVTRTIITYIPVVHKGVLDFLKRNCVANTMIFVPTDEFAATLRDHEEICALSQEDLARSLTLNFNTVDDQSIRMFTSCKSEIDIVMDSTSVCRKIRERYLQGCNVRVDTTFLRWDADKVLVQNSVNADRVSTEPYDLQIMHMAEQQCQMSSDWWRQVGAVLVDPDGGGNVFFAGHNHHMPSEQTNYMYGDPRDFVPAGTSSEICSAIHSEQWVLAQAAKTGTVTAGQDLYVTTFPCPACAKMVAVSGIARLFYRGGHVGLDAEKILRVFGVEIIHVPAPSEPAGS